MTAGQAVFSSGIREEQSRKRRSAMRPDGRIHFSRVRSLESWASLLYERFAMQAVEASEDNAKYHAIRDRLQALLILSLSVPLALGITYWSKELVRPRNAEGATVSTLRGIVGWPNSVDPIATLAGARRFSQLREFRGLVLQRVKPDGSLDIKDGDGSARFVFQAGNANMPAKLANAKPGLELSRSECPKQVVRLSRKGLVADPPKTSSPCLRMAEVLAPPKCSPKKVWQVALAKGASREGQARLEYYLAKGGPAWRFQINYPRMHLVLSGDCQRELSHEESLGTVP